jgi:hypothetical protein
VCEVSFGLSAFRSFRSWLAYLAGLAALCVATTQSRMFSSLRGTSQEFVIAFVHLILAVCHFSVRVPLRILGSGFGLRLRRLPRGLRGCFLPGSQVEGVC